MRDPIQAQRQPPPRSRQSLNIWLQILSLAALLALSLNAMSDALTSQYTPLQVEGYRVYLSPEVVHDKSLKNLTLQQLSHKLAEIATLLKPEQVAALQKIHFWIERNETPCAMVFHPAKEWLINAGYNPDKERGVEISNARNFLNWTERDQPMMVLHELSHAYLFLALGEDYEPLRVAWQNAAAKQLYEAVPYVGGGLRRAYALQNKYEYFAELSEAYFGRNDYFPFNREELRSYDAKGFQLMERAWGKHDQ